MFIICFRNKFNCFLLKCSRIKDEPQYTITPNELHEDYLIVRPLNPGQTYEFKLVAVDGEYSTESETQELEIVETDGELPACQYCSCRQVAAPPHQCLDTLVL